MTRHHAHRISGDLLVCSTGEHATARLDGRPMLDVPRSPTATTSLGARRTPSAASEADELTLWRWVSVRVGLAASALEAKHALAEARGVLTDIRRTRR